MPHAPSNRTLTALLRDRRGVVGIYFAIVLTGIVLLTMAGLDMIRVHLVRSRMWAAADAALLAGGKALADADWATQAANYFNANMGTSYMGASVTVTAADFLRAGDPNTGGTVVSADISGKVPLLSAGLMDLAALDIEISGEARQVTNRVELAMVLDNTGSMAGTRIAALRTAATTLMNILSNNQTAGTLTNAQVALVPYSAAVNPGAEAASLIGTGTTYDPNSKLGWKGCVIERPGTDTMGDTPPSTKKWEPYIWPDKNNSPGNGVDNNYDGNKESTVDLSKGNDSTGPNLGCPTAITPLTNDIPTLLNAINAMQAWYRGGTLSDIGMAWGQRVLSPGAPFTQGGNNPAISKAVVLMTDGETNFNKLREELKINKENTKVNSDYTGYKRLGEDTKLVNTTNTDTAKTIINNRLLSVCTTLRNSGTKIYTITFGVSDQTIKSVYLNCAGDTGKYIDAPTATDLQNAFSDIANDLTELILVK